MKYIIAMSIIAAVVSGVVIANVYPVAAQDHNSKEEMEHHAVLQVDIDNVFAPFGSPGFFKLLADFTDMKVKHGHVAISNVQCNSDGKSPFVVVVANANVGANNTKLALITLDSTNLVDDVSFKGKYCTYHVDIHGDNYNFPVTDIALANSSNSAVRPHSTASAAIHADIVEMEGEM